MNDFYDILGIAKSANANEIKRAYRKIAMKYHPDRNPDNKEALRKANSNKRTILEHCEDEDLIRDGVVNSGQVSLRLGLKGRPRKAEISSI